MWKEYINSNQSLLNECNITVYFKNVHLLSPPLQVCINSYLEDTQLSKRNKIISSFNRENKIGENGFLFLLYKQLSGISIDLPPLRSTPNNIKLLVNHWISQFNVEFAKQVIGCEPEAMDLLYKHHYPNNIDELYMLVRQMVVNTNNSYIKADLVSSLIDYNKRSDELSEQIQLDLNQPLHLIEQNIIDAVLKQENCNYTKTAARLGISRSTLWRRLKEINLD